MTEERKRYRLKKSVIRKIRYVCLAVLIVSLGLLLFYVIRYRNSRKVYDQIREEVKNVDPQPAIVVPEEIPGRNSTEGAASGEEQNTETAGEKQENTPGTYADIGITINWRKLKKKDHYITGWLYSPETVIDYPVAKYKDNEYFLTRNFERRKDEAGCLFFDYRNALSDNTLENWIMYGHRRNDGSMFGSLHKYYKESYYLEHPVMYYLTPEKNYVIEIFACRTVKSDSKYYPIWFQSGSDREKFISNAVRDSYWPSIFEPRDDCPVITLSTCSIYSGMKDPRLLVHGWLVPMDDKTEK